MVCCVGVDGNETDKKNQNVKSLIEIQNGGTHQKSVSCNVCVSECVRVCAPDREREREGQ